MRNCNSDIDNKIEKAFSINASAMMLWDGIWAIGMPFCMYSTVVPMYLLHLGASKTLIQFVVVGFSVITFVQFFTEPLMRSHLRKFWIFFTWIIFSFSWFIYGGSALLFWEKLPTGFWIVFFVLICALISSARHYGTPSLRGVVIENIPLRKRGLLASMRSFLLGLGGLLGTYFVAHLMLGREDVTMFHRIFFIGSIIFIIACLPFWFLFRDHAIEEPSARREGLSLWESAKHVWKEKNFRNFLILYCLLFAAQNLAPLLLSFSKDELHLKAQAVTGFNTVYFASALLLGATLPMLADRFGFKILAVLSSCMAFCCFAIPLFTNTGKYWLFMSYFLYAGSFQLTQLLLGNFGTELVPEVKPTTIIVIGSTLVMPMSLLIAPLGGTLVDHFGLMGYKGVFVFACLLALMALLGFLFFVKEPRHKHGANISPAMVEQKVKDS